MDYTPLVSTLCSLSLDWSKEDLRSTVIKHEGTKLTFTERHKFLFTKATLLCVKLVECEIRDSIINNSILEGCIIINCQIEDTTVKESYVEGEIKMEKVTLKSCKIVCEWARDCKFYDCVISSSRIIRSELHRSNILQFKEGKSCIQTSKIFECAAISTFLLNCEIENSSFEKSAIREGNLIKSSTVDCEITTAPLAFRKFPPEIRALIFSEVINTKLVAALRGQPAIYAEAIEIFRKRFPFIIRPGTSKFQSTIPQSLLGKIYKVVIRYSDGFGSNNLDCKVVPKVFENSKAITSICMDFTATKFESGRFLEVAQNWPRVLGTVRQFLVKFPPRRQPFISDRVISAESRARNRGEDVWHRMDTANILSAGDKCFKVKSRRIYKGDVGDDRWIWEAKDGQILHWTNAQI